MRHTRKQRAGSGVGQVIPRGGDAEAREGGGGGKRRWRILLATPSPIPILLDPRDTEQGKGVSSAFLPFSLSSALAMAEAGAGLSETVTETTVTVTTEPVRKAAEGGGRCCLGVWEIPWGRGKSFGVAGGAGLGDMGGVELNIWGWENPRFGDYSEWQRWCRRTLKQRVRV